MAIHLAVGALGRGVLFGLGAAVPIGPVNVEIARRALGTSWGAGACLGLGAVSVDVVYACLATAGVGVVGDRPGAYWPLMVGGTVMLTWLGVMSIRGAVRAYQEGWRVDGELAPVSLGRTYGTGVMMTAINPMTLVFWFTGLSSQAASMGIGRGELAYLAAGVFVGTGAWVLAFSSLMAGLGKYRRPWWLAAADLTGGVMLLGFAGLGAARAGMRIWGKGA